MADAPAGRRTTARTDDASSAGARFWASVRGAEPLALAVLGLSLLAALLLIAAEALPLWEVEVADLPCEVLATDPEQADACLTRGFEQHRFSFALLGVAALVMGAGAALGGSRPATFALLAVGVVVLGLGLAVDLPASRSTGAVGRDFLDAHAEGRLGLWLELAAGALIVAAGVVGLRRRLP